MQLFETIFKSSHHLNILNKSHVQHTQKHNRADILLLRIFDQNATGQLSKVVAAADCLYIGSTKILLWVLSYNFE